MCQKKKKKKKGVVWVRGSNLGHLFKKAHNAMPEWEPDFQSVIKRDDDAV